MKKNIACFSLINSQTLLRILILSLNILVIYSCSEGQDNQQPDNKTQDTSSWTDTITSNLELLFQSGFEPTTEVVSYNSDADIKGTDNSFSDHNDWIQDLDLNPKIGNFNIQYQGGDDSQRYAKITPDPEKSTNNVLQFWLNEPNVDGHKGRIQANLYGNTGMTEFYQSERIFLSSDFEAVRTYPDVINWLTIAEFWNNITWDTDVPYGFRITLTLSKPIETESDLYFTVEAQDCKLFNDGSQEYTTIWTKTNYKVKVPIGKWFTLEYYYKEGNSSKGKFYLAMTTESGETEDIFTLTRFTHNSSDPDPDGVTDFNPMKLYTSDDLINWVNSKGKTLQIFWDDFELWTNE